MAEGINRIVPPSVSLDRAPALGRERGKNKSGDQRDKTAEKQGKSQSGSTATDDDGTTANADKGNHLDIKA